MNEGNKLSLTTMEKSTGGTQEEDYLWCGVCRNRNCADCDRIFVAAMSVQVAMGLSEHSKTRTRRKKIKRSQTSGDHLPSRITTREESIQESIREGKEVAMLQGRRAYLGENKT